MSAFELATLLCVIDSRVAIPACVTPIPANV